MPDAPDNQPAANTAADNQAAAAATGASSGAGLLVFATLVLCSAFGEVATGLLVPALPALGEIYRQPPGTVQLTLVSFAILFAVGQLYFGPLSDRKGRRTALIIGAVLTCGGSVLAAVADSLWLIVAGRALQGLGAASGYVVARAIVRDIYGAAGSARAMALLFALMAGSFLFAPLAGGLLLDIANWRAGFVVTAALALAWLAATAFIMPETRRRETGPDVQSALAIYLSIFRHRGFLAFMIAHSLAYAGLYCFVAGAPYLFIDSLRLTPASFGVIAAIVTSGFLIGSMVARYAIPRCGMPRVVQASLAIMIGAPALLVVLDVLGAASVPVIAVLEFGFWFGGGFLAPNTAAGVMMSHPQAAGAAAAVLGFVQMCAAGAVSLLQGILYDGTVYPMIVTQIVLGVGAWVVWHRLKKHAL